MVTFVLSLNLRQPCLFLTQALSMIALDFKWLDKNMVSKIIYWPFAIWLSQIFLISVLCCDFFFDLSSTTRSIGNSSALLTIDRASSGMSKSPKFCDVDWIFVGWFSILTFVLFYKQFRNLIQRVEVSML